MQQPEYTARTLPARGAYLSWLYAAALFLSALLLFWIQPLFTRMALPFFGGAPAVWTTAAMFFQLALLAGYLYAHLLSRALAFRHQAVVHLALLVLVSFLLPPRLDEGTAVVAAKEPIADLLRLLAAGLGLPFFAIAATAPLLQRWFSRTRHADAPDPYFLYVASNAGSMIALVGYPFVIEPALGLARQRLAWTGGYALLALLIAACALFAWRHRDTAGAIDPPAGVSTPAVWRERAAWLLLSLAPVSLMLGVTQHISSEIAAVPLLWLAPLALYVATFINAFARRPPIKLEWSIGLQPFLVIALALVWMLNIYFSVFALHLLAFLVTALVCHGELARRRPSAERLTEFYFWIALGGALGGAFNGLAAPHIFDSIAEYPLAIALACMLRPASPVRPWNWLDLALPLVLAAAFVLFARAGVHPLEHGKILIVLYVETLGVVLYLMHRRPARFGLAVAATLLATPAVHNVDDVLARERSFFGVHTVLRDHTRHFNLLLNGVTVHGAQHLAPGLRYEPTTFYHRHGPLGQLFQSADDGRFRQVALVGLGTGSAVCHREAGRVWTIYEIDPVVVNIARDPRWFDFLAACAPDARIAVGDGRLSLAQAPDAAYDLIILDTFSSDAIPVHMITREAIALYFRKLTARGVLMVHISNQYLDLAPVLERIAADLGLSAIVPGDRLPLAFDGHYAQLEASWMAIARTPGDFTRLVREEGWRKPDAPSRGRTWTDDYSNILQALK